MNSKPKTLNRPKDDAQIPEIFPCSRGGVVIENYHEKDFFKKATHCQANGYTRRGGMAI
jgi:hypothetical protein